MSNKMYKQTPVSKIPDEWKVVTIDEICKVRRGASPRPIGDPSYFSGSGRGWIRISDVTDTYKYLRKTSQYLSKKGEERSVKVNPGDLIMSICATIGKPIILDMKACIHDGFVWFSELSNNVNIEYLFYVLQKNEIIFSSKRQTGTQGNLNTTLVGKTRIFLPPLPEQRRIAEVLGTVDSAIQKVGGAIEKTERLKKGLMQKLLTRGIGHERFKFSKELDCEIPEEWDVVKLEDVTAHVGSGLTPRGGALTYLDHGIPLIRSQNVLMNKLDLTDVAYISQETHKYMARSVILPGDILLNITGASIGRVAVVPKSITEANVNQHVCRIRFSETITPTFASYYLSSSDGQRQIMSFQAGATRQGLNYQQVKSILLPRPTLPEQRRIAEILSAADRKLELERRRKEKLERVKKGLMNELLTGRKRVKI